MYQRHFTYSFNRAEKVSGPQGDISVNVFTEKALSDSVGDELAKVPKSTLGLGPSFNLEYVMAKQGCIGCDENLLNKI